MERIRLGSVVNYRIFGHYLAENDKVSRGRP